MQSLIEQAKVIQCVAPAIQGGGGHGTWINTKNYDKVTFIIQTGTVATGGNVFVKKNDAASDSSASTHQITSYYKRTASTDTYTKTNADTSSSNNCIAVTNVNNLTYVVDVNAAELGENHFVTVEHPAAFSSCNFSVTAIAHKARYQQAAPPTALT